jgi:hypothetical protein
MAQTENVPRKIPDEEFLEMRWRCLSLAADLDRLERAGGSGSDPRLARLREAIAVLLESGAGRAERVQMIFSDQTAPPVYGPPAYGKSGTR